MEDIELKDGEAIEDLQCGGLKIIQSEELYRFSSDSVILANAVEAPRGACVVDLGCGSGVISLLLSKKTQARKIVGIEIQKALSDMAARSVLLNGLRDKIQIVNCDLREAHKAVGNECADAVAFNPPYEKGNQELKKDKDKAACFAELNASLPDFCTAAKRLLKFGGSCYLIIKAKRLADAVCCLKQNGLEPKQMTLVKRVGGIIDSAVITAKKGGKSGLAVCVKNINDKELQ